MPKTPCCTIVNMAQLTWFEICTLNTTSRWRNRSIPNEFSKRIEQQIFIFCIDLSQGSNQTVGKVTTASFVFSGLSDVKCNAHPFRFRSWDDTLSRRPLSIQFLNSHMEDSSCQVSLCSPPWLSQSRKFLNANYVNIQMTRINRGKLANFAPSHYSRSKTGNLSSNNEKTICSPHKSRQQVHSNEKFQGNDNTSLPCAQNTLPVKILLCVFDLTSA